MKPQPDPARELVVLLHGIAMPAASMMRIGRALRRAGYRVVNLGYSWRSVSLEQLAEIELPEALRRSGAAMAPRVHFVAHSMGGLVVRLHLALARPANLGRVVLLGPPNAGSAVADHLGRSPFIRWLTGPNLLRLGTQPPHALATHLPSPDYEVGVIAGTVSINPVFSRWLERPNDGAVSVASARLAGAADFLAVRHSHTGMLFRRTVIRQVMAFIGNGRFLAGGQGGEVRSVK